MQYALEVDIETSGDGYWSDVSKHVSVTGFDVRICNFLEEDYGELRVFFKQDSWIIDEDGLIYTDKNFKKELRQVLQAHGFDSSDVSYSEQGMQGDDYVSFDIGPKFIASWKNSRKA